MKEITAVVVAVAEGWWRRDLDCLACLSVSISQSSAHGGGCQWTR